MKERLSLEIGLRVFAGDGNRRWLFLGDFTRKAGSGKDDGLIFPVRAQSLFDDFYGEGVGAVLYAFDSAHDDAAGVEMRAQGFKHASERLSRYREHQKFRAFHQSRTQIARRLKLRIEGDMFQVFGISVRTIDRVRNLFRPAPDRHVMALDRQMIGKASPEVTCPEN